MRHIVSVLVENKSGALSRIAGLFSGRGFNIDSLSVGPTLDPSTSMMTIVTQGDDRIIEQITKQLNKLIDVIRVVDLTDKEYVERETALIKIHARDEGREEALRIADIFRAKIVDSTPNTYTIEITGDSNKIGAIINLLRPLGIKEFIRTGQIAIAREEVRIASVKEDREQKAGNVGAG
jgi:acetolactate synthase-1/3 small subunit